MKKLNKDGRKSKIKKESKNRERIIEQFHDHVVDGKTINLSKFLAKSILELEFGAAMSLDLFQGIDDYSIQTHSQCGGCGKDIIAVDAHVSWSYDTLSFVLEFVKEKQKWKIFDIQIYRLNSDKTEIERSSIFNNLTSPEKQIQRLVDTFKSDNIIDEEVEVSDDIQDIDAYQEILQSFLLAVPELRIVESHTSECKNYHTLIIEGKDGSSDSNIEIRLNRMLIEWVILDILMPKELPDGSMGERRSIFGFEDVDWYR